MEKKPKKKSVASGPKATKSPSDYKSRESEASNSAADSKFQKQIGKARDTQRKK